MSGNQTLLGRQVPVGQDADANLQAMLALYKAPATIRSMKQVFFYVDCRANVTNLEPLEYFYGVDSGVPVVNQFYFTKLGTEREFNIADKINDLIDIRVPKDKYVIEVNLNEAVIDGDPSSWTKIPDRVLRFAEDGSQVYEPTYRWDVEYSDFIQPTPPQTDPVAPPRKDVVNVLKQATKLHLPQTLFVKIKELDNGEPFNWSVTNSGQYSIDKSHQMLVRHGDVNYSKLTLQFGHLVFTGLDQSYTNEINKELSNAYKFVSNQNKIPPLTTLKETHRNYKYIDYNSEVFNVNTTETPSALNPFPDDEYANFYKNGENKADAYNLIQPCNRPPFVHNDLTLNNSYSLQGKPLFYNQQASGITFRFMIRIINLF